ncbi:hypothetical protein KAFR_0A06840 [Kazachstania africana CBS 2517]|uniref:Uncharacterized protein n=1 Tax=Kazachstania africana (strain ATCC 22294 / BCRC 22015 / CBS 2517 / CECT 1963 / NBRC 1671 / NRRL Y-8276) TaxID=1071382 RepID=H2AP19_KAZAF|nr:hypothetical protein KAFR_0A06840 [Kazachstania africana CBS 2517]CCF56119.1 hypothetical protein KAFR_0A06840 [Kazachstania africana CBS 2517]
MNCISPNVFQCPASELRRTVTKYTNEYLSFYGRATMSISRRAFNENSIVLVTGGSDGLGLEIVTQLVHKNIMKIIVIDVSPPKIPFSEDKIEFYKCDITNLNAIKRIHNDVKEKFGHISVLVNNAGITKIKSLKNSSYDEIERVIKVNYIGAYYIMQTFVPDMILNRHGYIINIASILGTVTPARLTTYGASKAGLISLHNSVTEIIRASFPNDSSIQTLLVCPGKLSTNMFADVYTPSKILAPDINATTLAKNIVDTVSDDTKMSTLKTPYYTNIVPIFRRQLGWPYLWLLKKISSMDEVTAI